MSLVTGLVAGFQRVAAEFKSVRADLANRVRVDAAQGLNTTQQSQARSNIGAQATLSDLSVSEGTTGTASTSRSVTATNLAQIIRAHVTGSATTAVSAVGKALVAAADKAAARAAIDAVAQDDTRLSDARPPLAHEHTASQITDASATGRSVLTGDAAAGRTALGAVEGLNGTTGLWTGTEAQLPAIGSPGVLYVTY